MNKRTLTVSAVPTVDTNAYAAGDLIGDKLTFDLSMALDWGGAILEQVILIDLAKQEDQIDLVLFGSDPSGTTFTDNAAADPADSDMAKVIAAVSVSTHFLLNDSQISVARGLCIPLQVPLVTTSIYGALVARAATDFEATTDCRVILSLRAP